MKYFFHNTKKSRDCFFSSVKVSDDLFHRGMFTEATNFTEAIASVASNVATAQNGTLPYYYVSVNVCMVIARQSLSWLEGKSIGLLRYVNAYAESELVIIMPRHSGALILIGVHSSVCSLLVSLTLGVLKRLIGFCDRMLFLLDGYLHVHTGVMCCIGYL